LAGWSSPSLSTAAGPCARSSLLTGDRRCPISPFRDIGQAKLCFIESSATSSITPTCSARHLPGYIDRADALKAKGIDEILCMAVNDVSVMAAWAKATNAGDKVTLLADGNGDYARALGLELDDRKFGMEMRGKRFSALIENGVVKQLNVEPPGEFGISSAETILQQLG
jgi:peroxiredoxin